MLSRHVPEYVARFYSSIACQAGSDPPDSDLGCLVLGPVPLVRRPAVQEAHPDRLEEMDISSAVQREDYSCRSIDDVIE